MVLAFSRDIPRAIPEILISGAEGLNYEVARPEIGEFAKYSSYYIDDGVICFEFIRTQSTPEYPEIPNGMCAAPSTDGPPQSETPTGRQSRIPTAGAGSSKFP